MFDFSWSELLLIGVVALIFIGPKELPGVLRTLGQWMSKIRRMAGEFQNQFHDAMREAELADIKKEVDEMAAQAAVYSNFDPLSDVRKEVESAQRDIESAVADKPAAERPAAGEPAAAPATDAPPAEPAAPVTAAGEAAKEPATEPVKQHSAAGSEPA
ncbi:MAG TPA: Sec-independent protein translocase protein TatB [Xanthobacteraceae bacterium]|jgi:sec-independent protein translocase protein TatB|nr:Sec-independent protein translocase protein TatB [Xanthobacteraceae bacterium]